MDNLIVSYLIQAHLKKNNKITQSLLESVIAYMKAMQHTHYSGEAMFRIVRAVATHWTKAFTQWKKALSEVGIGRPGLIRFKLQVIPKKISFSGKESLKKFLKNNFSLK